MSDITSLGAIEWGDFIEQNQLNRIAGFIWSIADDVLRDVYVRGKYRDAIFLYFPKLFRPMKTPLQVRW